MDNIDSAHVHSSVWFFLECFYVCLGLDFVHPELQSQVLPAPCAFPLQPLGQVGSQEMVKVRYKVIRERKPCSPSRKSTFLNVSHTCATSRVCAGFVAHKEMEIAN
jgi:hypothetical protein